VLDRGELSVLLSGKFTLSDKRLAVAQSQYGQSGDVEKNHISAGNEPRTLQIRLKLSQLTIQKVEFTVKTLKLNLMLFSDVTLRREVMNQRNEITIQCRIAV
jgi:hypothetical protein